MVKNKVLVAEAYEWDEDDVSSDDNDMTKVKVLIALANDENFAVGKESARKGEWVNIFMRKAHTLLDMEENDERKSFLDYLCIGLNYHVNTEILKENKNLRIELKELTAITKTWLNSSNKVNQCISELIPSQKKRILGLDQLTEYPSNCGQTDLVIVKSSTDGIKVSILGVERPWLSEAEGFTLPNHDTGRILPAGSQVKIIDPSVAITHSLATMYDSADESLVYSTHLPPLEKLAGAKPVSRPKTIKSILKSNSTFKVDTLKGMTINEPSSAPTKGNKNSLASKNNSAPASKLKNVKTKDDSPLSISDIRKPIWYLESRYSRHMTGIKSYLHKYVEQQGPKVVFRDDSTCITQGYGSIKFENQNDIKIKQLRTDNGTEFRNSILVNFYDEIEAARTMLSGSVFSKQYWTEVVAIACYTQNMSTIVKIHLKTPYEFFCGRIPNINFLHAFGCPVYNHNHKDYLGKFDEKADDGYFLRYSLVSKAFRVFNTRRQQTEETYHITFDESTNAIKFTKPSDDNITIAESERYLPDEYLHPYESSQRYQVNSNVVSFIDPYERPEPVVIETDVSSDQHDQADQNDQNDLLTLKILNHNTVYRCSTSKRISSLVVDASVLNTIPILTNPSLSIPSMAFPAPQDRWSQDKHIELVNIIGNLGAGMLTRAMANRLSVASAHECLFVDFLSEEEPKKIFEALKHP
ncbi:retrovirus-related pol polyprotein from transposon TNT 1-94 [Tanacetum coccineum]